MRNPSLAIALLSLVGVLIWIGLRGDSEPSTHRSSANDDLASNLPDRTESPKEQSSAPDPTARLRVSGTRKLSGNVIDPQGRGIPAEVTVEFAPRSESGSPRTRVTSTGADGRFELEVASDTVTGRAIARGKRTRGEVTWQAPADPNLPIVVPDIQLAPHYEVTLRVEVEPEVLPLLATVMELPHVAVDVELLLPPIVFGLRPRTVLHEFDLSRAPQQTATVALPPDSWTPGGVTKIRWGYFNEDNTFLSPLKFESLPIEAESLESTLSIDRSMIVTGRVNCTSDRRVSCEPVSLLIRSVPMTIRRVVTDDHGAFAALVPPKVSGVAFLRSDQSKQIDWIAGDDIRLDWDLSESLRVRVVDERGMPVREAEVRMQNSRTRNSDGLPDSGWQGVAEDGVRLTAIPQLRPGERVYVQVPGPREFAHACPELVVPGADPYVIRLTPECEATASTTVELAGRLRGHEERIRIELFAEPPHPNARRLEYQFYVERSGWTAHRLFPGAYTWSATVGDLAIGTGQLHLVSGANAILRLTL